MPALLPGVLSTWTAVLLSLSLAFALDNGLALTPPMGWMSWERFRCVTDCLDAPDDCLDERLIGQTARIMSQHGYADAGYVYLIVDDCWLSANRSRVTHRLLPDSSRFSRGLHSLSSLVHSYGLRFGLYEDYGNYTCSGYPGVAGHEFLDAASFAAWGVDYVKLDGCYWSAANLDAGYIVFGRALNATGRPAVYSCSWPTYQTEAGLLPDYELVMKTCNLWRGFVDVQDSWSSVLNIIDFYADLQDTLAPLAGPGHWNDPDMLIIGNYALSVDQARAQMAIWCVLAAPLLLSADLRRMRPEYREIVLNAEVIAVDQDALGIQGRRIYSSEGLEVWTKPVSPEWRGYKSYALVFLNRRSDGAPSLMSALLEGLGLYSPNGYRFRDLFEGYDYEDVMHRCTKVKVRVNPSGAVMLKARVVGDEEDISDCGMRVCDVPLPHIVGTTPHLRPLFKRIRDDNNEESATK